MLRAELLRAESLQSLFSRSCATLAAYVDAVTRGFRKRLKPPGHELWRLP